VLLGAPVKDLDFTTDATPQQVMKLFRRVVPTGLQHGTVTVLFQGQSLEVTTFRTDGEYLDGRHPSRVEFTRELSQDLARRDFTINALALDLSTGQLFDLHAGRQDLQNGVLRAIGEPEMRFQEDALRILRLFRFAAQLNFVPEADTLAAAVRLASTLAKISRERIRDEFLKTIDAKYPSRVWRTLENHGIWSLVFPGVRIARVPDELFATWSTLSTWQRLATWIVVALPVPGEANLVLESLRLSRDQLAEVARPRQGLDLLSGELGQREPVNVLAACILHAWGERRRIGPCLEVWQALRTVGFADVSDRVAGRLVELQTVKVPIFLDELAVSGRELIAAGIPSGPAIGHELHRLQKAVWIDPALNTTKSLLSLLNSPAP
jgi:tRNA nucleotidyltransferase/poly(A) polymerase